MQSTGVEFHKILSCTLMKRSGISVLQMNIGISVSRI